MNMADLITLSIDRLRVQVAPGTSVAAAIAQNGGLVTRLSVTGQQRAPLCGMGICQECRVNIDGQRHQLACQTLCTEGMTVLTGGAA
jgi:predicted molibdopterin-dependent oxidoreductase YjgC